MLPLVIIADLWSIVLKMFLGFLDIYNNTCFVFPIRLRYPVVSTEPIQSNGKDFGFWGLTHLKWNSDFSCTNYNNFYLSFKEKMFSIFVKSHLSSFLIAYVLCLVQETFVQSNHNFLKYLILEVLWFQLLCLGLLSSWNWFLHMLWSGDWSLFFPTEIHLFKSFVRRDLFLIELPWHLCCKSVDHKCVGFAFGL